MAFVNVILGLRPNMSTGLDTFLNGLHTSILRIPEVSLGTGVRKHTELLKLKNKKNKLQAPVSVLAS